MRFNLFALATVTLAISQVSADIPPQYEPMGVHELVVKLKEIEALSIRLIWSLPVGITKD
jgi:hypothetical protein